MQRARRSRRALSRGSFDVTTGSSEPLAQAGPLYFDASALIKLYLPETESDALNRLVAGRESERLPVGRGASERCGLEVRE